MGQSQKLRVLDRRWLKLVLCGVLVLVLWPLLAYPRGVIVGSSALAVGRPTFVIYGLPTTSTFEAASDFEEKYGIRVQLRGCMVPLGGLHFQDGHNAVTAAYVHWKFGDRLPAELKSWVEGL
jgi:hypothetical protein